LSTTGGRRAGAAGQAIAEFAIAAIPMLLLLLGILQFALIYNSQVGLTNAIRDAARYGSSIAVTDVATATTAANSTRTFLLGELPKYVSPYDATKVVTSATQVCYVQHSDGTTSGQPAFVRVTLAYAHPLFVPIISFILDGFDGVSDSAYRITVTTELVDDNPTQETLIVGTTPVCNS